MHINSDFCLTNAQTRVLDAARNWGGDLPFLVTGAAGTGKTSMASYLAAALGARPAYLAPTGKAAKVLMDKVPQGHYVGTIHSALYAPFVKDPVRYDEVCKEIEEEESQERPRPSQIRRLKAELRKCSIPVFECQEKFVWQRPRKGKSERVIDTIIVDEASMIGSKLGGELVSVARAQGYRVIAVGDFYQLPPVGDMAYFEPGKNCHAAPALDEIVRQAEGSHILDIADTIRKGGTPRGHTNAGDLWDYHMILCGKNATRHAINDRMRREQGIDRNDDPQPGEDMIVLRNTRDFGVVNGEIFRVDVVEHDQGQMWITGIMDSGARRTFPVIIEPQDGFDPRKLAQGIVPVAYAYAITAHKAQGSEWPDVLVVDESGVFREDKHRWLYTAVTRAKENVTLTRNIE